VKAIDWLVHSGLAQTACLPKGMSRRWPHAVNLFKSAQYSAISSFLSIVREPEVRDKYQSYFYRNPLTLTICVNAKRCSSVPQNCGVLAPTRR
jgi:hypothetical protein